MTIRQISFPFCIVRRSKCCLSWALLLLMFAVALVPAGGLSMYHTHDDHDDSGEHEHSPGPTTFGEIYHAVGVHHAEGLHAHQIGLPQIQKSSAFRETGAPVLVALVWLNVLASVSPAHLYVDVPRASVEAKTLHAPPPLLRSMAFLI